MTLKLSLKVAKLLYLRKVSAQNNRTPSPQDIPHIYKVPVIFPKGRQTTQLQQVQCPSKQDSSSLSRHTLPCASIQQPSCSGARGQAATAWSRVGPLGFSHSTKQIVPYVVNTYRKVFYMPGIYTCYLKKMLEEMKQILLCVL